MFYASEISAAQVFCIPLMGWIKSSLEKKCFSKTHHCAGLQIKLWSHFIWQMAISCTRDETLDYYLPLWQCSQLHCWVSALTQFILCVHLCQQLLRQRKGWELLALDSHLCRFYMEHAVNVCNHIWLSKCCRDWKWYI